MCRPARRFAFESRRTGTIAALIALSLLSGCTQVAPVEPQPDPRVDLLLTGMEQCLAAQQASDRRLTSQSEQLKEQQLQLESVSEQLGELPRSFTPPPSKPPPPVTCPPRDDGLEGKQIVGRREQVWVADLGLALPARIDTGAQTAALDAQKIEVFERNSDRWVRFEVRHPKTGEPLPQERPVTRMVSVVQSNGGGSERRPVVKLDVVIGRISQTAEFTLSDRSHSDYQMLVGRNILRDVMLVDVSRQNIAPQQLPAPEAKPQ